MEDMKRTLTQDEMEKVTGGTRRKVNTGVDGLDAALRSSPSKKAPQIGHLPNGTEVDTVTNERIYDPESDRHFVEVTTQDGRTGWIASSILGMRR